MQIEDWLRQADKYIREGRYLAADELLQKVFAIHPEHEVATAYQERIEFLINQLAKRVGLRQEVQVEIRKYQDLLRQRKSYRIGTLLVNAQKMLDEGHFRKAAEQANKVLALDHANVYAKGLLHRLAELQKEATSALTENEYKFRSILRESWRDGAPSEDQQQIIGRMQKEMTISDHRRKELEIDAKNALYKEALLEIWYAGGLSAFTPESIDQLRVKYRTSQSDHSLIEANLLREMRKNKIKGTALVVDANETFLLEIAYKLRSSFYAVISAASVEEALTVLKTVNPNVILSEVNFQSGLMGFDLFEFVRATAATSQIPFMFMTPNLDRTTLLIGKRLGVDEFMTKPLDYDLLVATLAGRITQQSSSPHRSAEATRF